MISIRTIGVLIAVSAATTVFAGEQVQWRADELKTDSHLTRAQVIQEYQAARAAHQIVEGDLMEPMMNMWHSTRTRAQVTKEAGAARAAGTLPGGDR